jgi:dimethylsulfone monooxygenase
MAAKYSDWYFINGNSVEGVKEQIDEVRALATAEGRTVKFGLNGFVIQRPTEAEALEQLEAIVAGADPEIVRAFGEQVKNAGQSTREKIGMWANSDYANLVQPNDGFKTRLFGPPELIAERVRAYEAIGVDLILCAFLHFTDELPAFGREVIPLLRKQRSRIASTQAAPEKILARCRSKTTVRHPFQFASACGRFRHLRRSRNDCAWRPQCGRD